MVLCGKIPSILSRLRLFDCGDSEFLDSRCEKVQMADHSIVLLCTSLLAKKLRSRRSHLSIIPCSV